MNAVSLTTTAHDGPLRDPSRLKRFLRKKKWPLAIATAEQVHGARVKMVEALRSPREFKNADGLLTAQAGQPLGIFTADCVPIFIEVPSRGVVGLLHAGWRGVRSRILDHAVRLLRRRWRAKANDIYFWTGPAIGACCFEVGWEVARYFPKTRRRDGERWRVDLAGEIRIQARGLGLRERQKAPPACTMHHKNYFSFRRDRTRDRQVSIILMA